MPRQKSLDVGLIVTSQKLIKAMGGAVRSATIWTGRLRRSQQNQTNLTIKGLDVVETLIGELAARYSPRVAGNVMRLSANKSLRPVRVALKAASPGRLKKGTRATSYLLLRGGGRKIGKTVSTGSASVYAYAGWSFRKAGIRGPGIIGHEFGNQRQEARAILRPIGERLLPGAARRYIDEFEAQIPKAVRAAARAARRREGR